MTKKSPKNAYLRKFSRFLSDILPECSTREYYKMHDLQPQRCSHSRDTLNLSAIFTNFQCRKSQNFDVLILLSRICKELWRWYSTRMKHTLVLQTGKISAPTLLAFARYMKFTCNFQRFSAQLTYKVNVIKIFLTLRIIEYWGWNLTQFYHTWGDHSGRVSASNLFCARSAAIVPLKKIYIWC